MEKDLRDAFKALTLVRADLVATRQAKADADRQWRSLANEQRAQIKQLQEALAMRDEDVRQPNQQKPKVKTPVSPTDSSEAEPEQENADGSSDEQEEDGVSLEEVAKDHLTLLKSVYDLKTQVQAQAEQLVAQEATHAQKQSEWTLLNEARERQLTKLQETQLDLVREKKFMDEKFEFLSAEVDVVKSERDALRQRLEEQGESCGSLQDDLAAPALPTISCDETARKLRELQDEMQRMVDEHTQREACLSRENVALQHKFEEQVALVESLRRSDEKLEHERDLLETQLQHERVERDEEKQTMTCRIDELNAVVLQRDNRVQELEKEIEQIRTELRGKQDEIDSLVNDRTELVQQLQQIRDHASEQLLVQEKQEEERMKSQHSEQEKLQHELTTLLASFEAATAENAVKMSSLQRTNDGLQQALSEKSKELAEAQTSAAEIHDRLQHQELVVDMYHREITNYQDELRALRDLVLQRQQQISTEAEKMLCVLHEEFTNELKSEQAKHESAVAEKEQQLVASEVEQRRLEGELEHVQDAARALRAQLDVADKDRESQLAQISVQEQEISRLKSLIETGKDAQRTAHESDVRSLRETHDQELLAAKSEQAVLTQKINELRSSLERLERDFALARDAVEEADRRLQNHHTDSDQRSRDVEHRLQSLEQQLMEGEDNRPSILSAGSWALLSSQIRVLDDFLPQLQLFAGRLHTSLQLCGENARAMHVLSSSPSASPTLLSDLSTLLRLADQLKQLFAVQGLSTHVRLVRRSVLATLSQWFEEGEESSSGSVPPSPPFGIESQEVAIVLQNWTADIEKRERVAQWLKQIATSTKQSTGEKHGNDEDQATLELKDMTREVKDAFCMLIVPLLKQNRAVSVRVFTRRVCDIKSSYSPDETCWEMRIHVQFSPRRMSGSRSQRGEPWVPGPLRRISSTSSVSSVGSTTSSLASSLSLSSVSSASKLQIIQAKLQQMQQQSSAS